MVKVNENIRFIGDLLQYDLNDLLRFQNFGKNSLEEIKEYLSNYNLKNYDLIHLDVIKEYDKNFSSEKFDFIVSGCLDMTRIKKKPFYDINIWLSTMLLAFLNLNPGGIFAFNIR